MTKIVTLKKYILELARRIDDKLYENKNPIRILFIRTDNYGFSCLSPIIKKLSNNSDAYIKTTTHKPQSLKSVDFNSQEENEIFNQFYINNRLASYMKWHLIIDTHPNCFYPKRNALRIGMHHGSGFGILGSKVHYVKNYDIFFGLSQSEGFFLKSLDPAIFDDLAFFPVGNPKLDTLLSDICSNRNRLKNKLALKNKKTILITSHWQKGSTLYYFGSNVFETLAQSFPEYNIIQTCHPWCWNENKQKFEAYNNLFNQLKAIEDKYSSAYFLPFENPENLLILSDLLVADHSSIMTSFSLTDRPIVWFDNPEIEFAIPEIKDIYRSASRSFNKIENLPKQCEEALNNPLEKKQGRKIMRKTFHANPGNAAEVAAETIQKIGSICSKKSPRWKDILNMSYLIDLKK